MRGALEDPAAIGALAFEHAARIMQAVSENVDVGVGPRHQLPVVPDHAIDLVERNSHDLSPGLTLLQLAAHQPSRGSTRGTHPQRSIGLLRYRGDNSAA